MLMSQQLSGSRTSRTHRFLEAGIHWGCTHATLCAASCGLCDAGGTFVTAAACVQSGHAGRIIEGIIMDIGWYRTMIRSFEREVYIVPNSVFSRTVVLNVTRKGKEWRVFENIGVRVEDIAAIPDIVNHMRRIIREVRRPSGGPRGRPGFSGFDPGHVCSEPADHDALHTIGVDVQS